MAARAVFIFAQGMRDPLEIITDLDTGATLDFEGSLTGRDR